MAIFILTLWLLRKAGPVHNFTINPAQSLRINVDKMQPNLVGIFQGLHVSAGPSNRPILPPAPVPGASNHHHVTHAEGQPKETINDLRLKAILHSALALHPSSQPVRGPGASCVSVPLVCPNPPSKLLAVSPNLPAKMLRGKGQWNMADFSIQAQLYKASRVCEGDFGSIFVGSRILSGSVNSGKVWRACGMLRSET